MKNFTKDATVLDVYRLLSAVEKQAGPTTVLSSIQLSVTPTADTTEDIYSLTVSVYTPNGEPGQANHYLVQHILTTTDKQLAKLLVDGGSAGEAQDYHNVLHDFAVQPSVRLAKLELLAAA